MIQTHFDLYSEIHSPEYLQVCLESPCHDTLDNKFPNTDNSKPTNMSVNFLPYLILVFDIDGGRLDHLGQQQLDSLPHQLALV